MLAYLFAQFYREGNILTIEAEIIDQLDHLFMHHRSAEAARAYFLGQLKSLFDDDDLDQNLRRQIDSFLVSLDAFLSLVLVVADLPVGEEVRENFARELQGNQHHFVIPIHVVSRRPDYLDIETNVVHQGNGAKRNVYPIW